MARLFGKSISRCIACLISFLALSDVNAGVVSPEVDRLIRLSPGQSIDIVCYVDAPSVYRVASDVRSEFAGSLKHFGDVAKSLALLAQERRLTPFEEADRKQALEAIDDILNERGSQIKFLLAESAASNLATVSNAITAYGGIASDESSILPSVRGLVPASRVHELAAHPNITYIDVHLVGGPLLDNQKVSLGLTDPGGFWTNGYNGGIFDVGMIDTGVQRNHPAFSGFGWEGEVTDPEGHGTGVGGMMFSHDTTYRGMAFSLDTVSVQFAEIGMRESTDWLLTHTIQRPEAINVSWGGQSPDTNEYQAIEAWYDSAVDAFGITFGQAAGNEGASGWNSLVYPSKAYNTIAVANVNDLNTVSRSDDSITASSSRGPTPSGRKKPDISAPGHNTISTTRTLGFGNLGGTSSAAPKVTGAAVLLRSYGTTSSIADKAVLINSADSWSDQNTVESQDDGPVTFSHWSRSYGWGYINLLKAYQQAPRVIEDSFTRPLIVGARRLAYYSGSRSSGFKATLVWNRHVGPYTGEDPIEYDSLTNFNLGLYSGATGVGISQSISTIDNVEQVGSSSSGASVLKVQTTGTWDIDVPSEDYALAVPTAFVRKNPPTFQITVNAVQYAVVGSEISVMGTVTNTGQLPAYNVLASVNAVVTGGNNPTQLGTLDPGESVPANWIVQVNQSSGPQTIRLSVEGSGYGETFSNYSERVVTVIPFYLAPTSFTRVRGTIISGDLSSVTTSNNVHLTLQPGITISSSQWPVELIFTGNSPVASPGHFYARVEANATSISVHQRVEVYNYVTAQWVELSSQPLTTSDNTLILAPPAPRSEYVQAGTRQVRIRLSSKAFGPVLAYPWRYRIDQVGWHIAN